MDVWNFDDEPEQEPWDMQPLVWLSIAAAILFCTCIGLYTIYGWMVG